MSTLISDAFHTFRCKLNFSETATLVQSFKNAGYSEVAFDDCHEIELQSIKVLDNNKANIILYSDEQDY